ncbi:MAG: DUF885 domain-containing protein [Woeseiaceae bacterium]|jgi:uncharacterized protein (DUF885 family)|nr:DUF885 domain-containing protein [Woeseiaceae bacterium]
MPTKQSLVLAALATLAIAFAADVRAQDATLDALMADYWDYYLEEYPVAATRAGIDEFNDRLGRVTPDALAEARAAESAFLRRLADIDEASLSEQGRLNAELFDWVLRDAIEARDLGLERIPFNTFSGFYMEALTASSGVRMDSADDYRDYLARMRDIPRWFAENIANMQRGAETGFVLPRIVIEGVLPTLRSQLKDRPEDSSFYEPFETMAAKLGVEEAAELEAAARQVIKDDVFPAFESLVEYLESEYPASATIGASELENGKAYYAFQIRRYTTLTDIDADEIHATGLAEVARIRREMDAIIEEVGFEGDFAAFTGFLRTDPQFYAETPEALLKEAAWIAKRIDYRLPGFFGKLPRQPYGIVPVPEEIAPNYTTGAYYGAPLGGEHGGAYWLNTYALDQRPLYELPALTLHEAVPGHHLQGALALEMDEGPEFRRDLYFSAFGEGWALYTERLGVEMGIYRTPYEHFGRLSYEMWRACRLVVDTGMHAKGWTRDEAIRFMTRNTGLSESNIRAEIDRYISWPGQALAYKLGELEIRELRSRAETALGDAFDLREFHDAVLANGALPLAMLEGVVEAYIELRLP